VSSDVFSVLGVRMGKLILPMEKLRLKEVEIYPGPSTSKEAEFVFLLNCMDLPALETQDMFPSYNLPAPVLCLSARGRDSERATAQWHTALLSPCSFNLDVA
jgi:hypothetical protein